MAKMQPFWWFLPPTASKLCWWSHCQTCTPWTLTSTQFTCEVDTVDYKECAKSLKFSYTYKWSDISSYSRAVTQCADVFGVYLKANIATAEANLRFRITNAAGDGYVEIVFYNETGVGIHYQIAAYKNGEGAIWTGPTYPYTNNTWIWFEVYDNPVTGVCQVYVNGTELSAGGRHVFRDSDMATLTVKSGQSSPSFSFWVDFMRMYSAQQYPPKLEKCEWEDSDGEP